MATTGFLKGTKPISYGNKGIKEIYSGMIEIGNDCEKIVENVIE